MCMIPGRQSCTIAAVSTTSLRSVWTSQMTWSSVTEWATTRCCCPTCWSTRLWLRSSSRLGAGCHWCTRTATRALGCSCAPFLRPCAWRGPSTHAAGSAKMCVMAAHPLWKRLGSPGLRCSLARSFRKMMCASVHPMPQRPPSPLVSPHDLTRKRIAYI